MSYVPAQCRACSRLRRTEAVEGLPPEDTDPWTACDAFPDDIPLDIALGADHRLPRGGERDGLTFRLAPGPAAEEAYREWEHTFGGLVPLPSIPTEGDAP